MTARTPRDLDTREAFFRPESWAPAALMPEFKKQDGWAYRWIRTSMAGQADAANVSLQMREGWEPVKRSDHPEIRLLEDPQSRFKDSIETGGLLLCKCPQEFIDQRTEYYRRRTQQQTDSVDNSYMQDNDPRMSKFADKKSKVSFGPSS